MQQALLDHAGLRNSHLEVSEFIMVKVTTSSQHTCYLIFFPSLFAVYRLAIVGKAFFD